MAQIRRFFALYASVILASVAAASPVLDKRQDPWDTTVVFDVTTVQASATTITKNPLDSTSWIEYPGAAFTEYPFTTSSTSTAGCVSYSQLYPRTRDVVTVTNTITVTVRSTVTVTRTDRPATTAISLSQRTVTATTGKTEWSTRCTNTLVESFYVSSTRTVMVWPSATVTEAATRTEVCVRERRVSAWAAGPLPTTEPYVPALSRFLSPGAGTLVSIKLATTRVATSTVREATSTRWSVVCDNPTTKVQEVWYTATVTPTVTVGCSVDGGARGQQQQQQQQQQQKQQQQNQNSAEGQVRAAKRAVVAQQVIAREAKERVQRTETRTYSTVGLREGSVVTSMVTEVVDYLVATFTSVEMVVVTATADAATVTRCKSAGGLDY